jgi:hypothetical protein
MKAGKLVDICIECGDNAIVVEMPNGNKVHIKDYSIGWNDRGEMVVVLVAGKAKKDRNRYTKESL